MHHLVAFRAPRLFPLSKLPLKAPEVWVPAPSSPLRRKRSRRLPAGDPASVLCTEVCTQPTRVETPTSTHACLVSQVYFSYLKICSLSATLAKSSTVLGGALVPVHVGVSARAHLRMRTRASRGPVGGLPLLR